jgi:hypothetical protein
MVLAEVDSDAILVEAMRNRTAGEMIKTYNKLIHRLKACGIQPKHHILDNECSEEFKKRNQKPQHDVPTSTAARPSTELSGTSNSNLQSTFHLNIVWSG